MRGKLALLVCLTLVVVAAIAGTAKASYSDDGYNGTSFCYSWEQGRWAQNGFGQWFVCSWDGNGPTGYEWHPL